jgi:hypothetical protein
VAAGDGGESVDAVDRTGVRGAGAGDDGDRRDARPRVGGHRRLQLVLTRATLSVDGDRHHRAPPQPQHGRCTVDRPVRERRRVDAPGDAVERPVLGHVSASPLVGGLPRGAERDEVGC